MVKDQSTEDKILEAAEQVFLKDGYDGTRMQTIAETAGINKALLHYYFRSKDKLFELIFQWKINQFLPQVAEFIHDPRLSFPEKMEKFIEAYIQMLLRNPYLPMFILNTIQRNPGMVQKVHYQIGKDLVDIMNQEITAGRVRKLDPIQFLLTVMGMCIFPFLAKPMIQHLFAINEADFQRIQKERVHHATAYAKLLLQPE